MRIYLQITYLMEGQYPEIQRTSTAGHDGRRKGMCSSPPAGALELQLASHPPLRRTLEPTEKGSPTSRDKDAAVRWQQGHNHDKLRPHTCPGGRPTDTEQYYQEGSPTAAKSSGAPRQASQPGDLTRTKSPQGIWP